MNNGFTLIKSINEIGKFINDLIVTEEIGLDIESTGLDIFSDELLLLQVNINNNIYIFDAVNLGIKYLTYIVDLINSSNKVCIGHNIKYDIKALKAKTGILIKNVFDTFTVENVLMTGKGTGYPSLASIMKKYLGITLDKDIRDEFIGATAVTQEMLIYASLDVKYLFELKRTMLEFVEREHLVKIIDLENKLIPVVADMEFEGVLINTELWKKLTDISYKKATEYGAAFLDMAFEGIKDKLQGKNAFEMFEMLHVPMKSKKVKEALKLITEFEFAFSVLRKEFNINSNVQLLKLLQLNDIPVLNTKANDLENIKNNYDLVKQILIVKPYLKRVSSFGEDFIQKINPVTKRLHANFNQLGTSTGRWSSDNPNLQQIPKEKEETDLDYEDVLYRHCFIARPGYKLLTVDYNQAELRLLGAISGEPEFVRAYQTGLDLHQLTGSHIFHKPFEEVTKAERWVAKQVNFAIIYGSSEYGLYYNFNIPIEDGRKHLFDYGRAYPYINQFMNMAGEKIWGGMYSVTPLGRKRFFEPKSVFENWREAQKFKASVIRKGFNMIVQGGSADILKLALIDIYYNNPFGDDLKILMTVHDEGIFEIKEDIIDNAVAYVVGSMEKTEQQFLMDIPAKADYAVSDIWSK